MDQNKWFLLLDGQVTGPFGDQEVETHINKAKDPLIWGRGQSEWLPPDKWRAALKALIAQQNLERQGSRQWKMRVNKTELTPMSMDELIEQLKEYTDLSPVRIWTEGFDDWKEVFQVRKVMDEIGISRRNHPRVPIMGDIKAKTAGGDLNAKVITISEGGAGVNHAKGLQIGDTFSAEVSSPNLFVNFNCKVEVVYLGSNGYAGLRFLDLNNEARAAIIEYVKKFQQVQT